MLKKGVQDLVLIVSILLSSLLLNATQISNYSNSNFTGIIPILQGYTTDTGTILTALRSKSENRSYEVRPLIPFSFKEITNELIISNSVEMVTIKSHSVGDGYYTDQIEVRHLKPNLKYELIIKDDSGTIIDTRQFSPINAKQADPQVAICSCSRIGLLSPEDKLRPMWDRLADTKPDAVLFLGDIVYGDNALQAVLKFLFNQHPTFKQIQKRFLDSWKKERIYRQEKLIPLFSIWDDHDYGYEASDKDNPFKKRIYELFHSYYPTPKHIKSVKKGPGSSYSFNLFGRKIIMLDDRSYFSEKNKTLFGEKQIKWLEKQIQNETEVIIAAGVSIVSLGKKNDSLERISPTEFEALKQLINKHSTRAIFLAGDVHFSEVLAIPEDIFGYKTYQVISSPVKSTSPLITPPFKSGKEPNNPNQLVHVSGYNFALLSMDSLFKKLDVTFHRSGVKPPVRLVDFFEAPSCLNYY